MMYLINLRQQDGWHQEYRHFETDADAMISARNLLATTESIMVAVYRHRDLDTCGVKDFVVAYDR